MLTSRCFCMLFFIPILIFPGFTLGQQNHHPAPAIWKTLNTLELHLPHENYDPNIHDYTLTNYLSSGSEVEFNYPLTITYRDSKTIAFKVDSISKVELPKVIKSALALVGKNRKGQIQRIHRLQLGPLLDSHFIATSDLGCQQTIPTWTCRLWAPTAKSVSLLIFENEQSIEPIQVLPLTELHFNQDTVWQIHLNQDLENKFYLFSVNVFMPQTNQFESNLVTDPYSFSLSVGAKRSRFINPHLQQHQPKDWDKVKQTIKKSSLIYELHLRDATAQDKSISFFEKGTFLGLLKSQAFSHLNQLAQNGLSHVEILPFNDFGSVNEETKLRSPQLSFNSEPDSEIPQEQIGKNRDDDAYNWGYDPVHYFSIEGSYLQDQSSSILELRTFVQKLREINLGVIQDVVFNHTYRSGRAPQSVLDQIVPLYYYRLDALGNIQNSSCCADTDTDRFMMEKLMSDSILYFAKTFKISGFRIDLMSFHSRESILKIRQRLQEEGLSHVLIFGEGWSFGSLYDKAPQRAMTQINAFGSNVGTFNDRMRDAIRGGTPSSAEISDQGWATGLYYAFNEEPANRNTPINLEDQKMKLLHYTDVIKIGLAGNLRDFYLEDHLGHLVRAGDIFFRGSPTGYTASARENIVYASAHDGYTLWDSIQAKVPFHHRTLGTESPDSKMRRQKLALAAVLLSQGDIFLDAGIEFLRSKSGDQDSYNSADWFNAIDFSFQASGWGRGLPVAWKNWDQWNFWRPRLADFKMDSQQRHRIETFEFAKELMQFRMANSHFQMSTLTEIQDHLKFYPSLEKVSPGLIVFSIEQPQKKYLIALNPNPEPVLLNLPQHLKNLRLVSTFKDLQLISNQVANQKVQVNGLGVGIFEVLK